MSHVASTFHTILTTKCGKQKAKHMLHLKSGYLSNRCFCWKKKLPILVSEHKSPTSPWVKAIYDLDAQVTGRHLSGSAVVEEFEVAMLMFLRVRSSHGRVGFGVFFSDRSLILSRSNLFVFVETSCSFCWEEIIECSRIVCFLWHSHVLLKFCCGPTPTPSAACPRWVSFCIGLC